MIDPLAAIIAYLSSQGDLNTEIDNRLASKHKFSMPESDPDRWENPSKALQVRYAPGAQPDLYTGNGNIRLEALCYGPRQEEAAAVYGELMAICDAFQRATAATEAGTALIYWLLPDSSPEFGYDPDVNMDFVRTYLKTSVARTPVA